MRQTRQLGFSWRSGRVLVFQLAFLSAMTLAISPLWAQEGLRQQAEDSMKRATEFYHGQVASHGGYVYHYLLDLTRRWGEGEATADQIWIQPPGTPTVGLAFVKAYRATGDDAYLRAATDAAMAVVYGQLKSGGWTNCVDFNPNGDRTADYRNGKGRGKNNSSLDDGQSQMALRLLMHVDRAHGFRHGAIHNSVQIGLEALLKAQFPNGGFPQVWTGPVEPQPVLAASYPEYEWRTEGRIKNYWDMYTINDNVCGYLAETLIDAYEIYGDDRFLQALRDLGKFLQLAQMPDPQPAWAQQYNYAMKPIWARKFEPPAITGSESQQVISTLIRIASATGDQSFLEPIPEALAYFERSQLPDGRLARFYELKTNRPLYMKRDGDVYTLTYDDSDVPGHYSWKVDSRIDALRRQYRKAQSGEAVETDQPPSARRVGQIVEALDAKGRWVSKADGEKISGGLRLPEGTQYLSSARFSKNLSALADFVKSKRDDRQN